MAKTHKLSGLDEAVRLGGARRPANVVIDTGFGLEPIGPSSNYTAPDEFELGDGGEAELHVWDGRSKLASATLAIMDGSEACALLEKLGAVDPDECADDYRESVLSIDYVRVDAAHRGGGYSISLIETAVKAFARRGWWVYADAYSQRIYANLRSVLGVPKIAMYDDEDESTETDFAPTDASILAHLDPLPIEGRGSYKGYGLQLSNRQHVHLLWKV